MQISQMFKRKPCVFSIECFPPKQTANFGKMKDTLRTMRTAEAITGAHWVSCSAVSPESSCNRSVTACISIHRRCTDCTHLSSLYKTIQRFHRLLNRSIKIKPVNDIQIQIVGSKPF